MNFTKNQKMVGALLLVGAAAFVYWKSTEKKEKAGFANASGSKPVKSSSKVISKGDKCGCKVGDPGAVPSYYQGQVSFIKCPDGTFCKGGVVIASPGDRTINDGFKGFVPTPSTPGKFH